MSGRAAVVVGCHWFEAGSELAFVTRSLAGVASRVRPVAVLAPHGAGRPRADGAFDVQDLGVPGALAWPEGVPADAPTIVDDLGPDVTSLLRRSGPASVHFLSGNGDDALPGWQPLPLAGGDEPLGVPVPVNRLAEANRHHGFGFTDYLLVLGGPSETPGQPPPAVAWLSAAFDDAYVVVIQDAVAAAWKGRALRGTVTVDTRMDLWRLLAHAHVCVDLDPGALIARECVESLRFGTPIVVPDGTGPGAIHARATGGATFSDEAQLLDGIASLEDPARRAESSAVARHYADAHYGESDALAGRLQAVLGE